MTSSSYATALLAHRPPLTRSPPIPPGLSTPALLLMAVACGLCAGSNYFNQPLLHSIATQLQVRDASAALIESASLNLKYPFGLSLSKPCAALRQAQRERFK